MAPNILRLPLKKRLLQAYSIDHDQVAAAPVVMVAPHAIHDAVHDLRIHTGNHHHAYRNHHALMQSKPAAPSSPSSPSSKRKCGDCGKVFPADAFLQYQAHVRRHKSKISGKYECHVCNKKFVQRSSLTTHLRIHSGEKPYACHDCPDAFSDFSTYTKHRRTHTGEKPYPCPECGRRFSQSGNMNRHLKAVHEDMKEEQPSMMESPEPSPLEYLARAQLLDQHKMMIQEMLRRNYVGPYHHHHHLPTGLFYPTR